MLYEVITDGSNPRFLVDDAGNLFGALGGEAFREQPQGSFRHLEGPGRKDSAEFRNNFV